MQYLLEALLAREHLSHNGKVQDLVVFIEVTFGSTEHQTTRKSMTNKQRKTTHRMLLNDTLKGFSFLLEQFKNLQKKGHR